MRLISIMLFIMIFTTVNIYIKNTNGTLHLRKPEVIQSATQMGVTYVRGQPNGIFDGQTRYKVVILNTLDGIIVDTTLSAVHLGV